MTSLRALAFCAFLLPASSLFSAADPVLTKTIEHILGADTSDARRVALDRTNGDAFVVGDDDNLVPHLKFLPHESRIPSGDLPTGPLADDDGPARAEVAVDGAAGRYYVAGPNAVTAFAFGNLTPLFTVPLGLVDGARPRQMAINTVNKRLYVTISPPGFGADVDTNGSVKVINGTTGAVIASVTQGVRGPNAIAVNETTGKVYVTNIGPLQEEGTNFVVSVIDGSTNAVTPINFAVPASFGREDLTHRLVVNSTTNKVYVLIARTFYSDESYSRVGVINGQNNTISGVIDLLAGEEPLHGRMLAIDPLTNRIFLVTDEDQDQVRVINGSTNTFGTPVAVAANGDFRDIAFDGVNNELVVLLSGSLRRQPEAAPYEVLLSSYPAQSAVNPVTRKVYVTDTTRHVIFVLNADTGLPIKTITLANGAHPYFVAVNPTTNRIYVTSDTFGFEGGHLHVINGDTDVEITNYPVLAYANGEDGLMSTFNPSEIIVDVPNHRLFVRQDSLISIVNTDTDTVDPAAILTGSASAGADLTRIAYNPTLQRIYSLEFDEESDGLVVRMYNVPNKTSEGVFNVSVSPGASLAASDIVYNPSTDRVYVAGYRDRLNASNGDFGLYVFNGAGSLLDILTSPGSGDDQPEFSRARFVINQQQNRLYAATRTSFQPPALVLMELNAGTGRVIGLPGTSPSLVFLEDTHELFLTSLSTGEENVASNAQTRIFEDVPQPGRLEFSAAQYTVAEGTATATITVKRVGGVFGQISASYATSDASALAGQDYTAISGTVTFPAGSSADRTFEVSITDDVEVEGTESLKLMLSDPTNGAELGTAQATLVITSANDAPPAGSPVISGSLSATAEVNRPFVYGIKASKTPNSYGAVGLPAGFTINPVNGVIRATAVPAEALASSPYYVKITATNRFGTGVATLVLTVVAETKPDLTPSFTNLSVRTTATGGLLVQGFGKITNAGNRAAVKSRTQSYISDDAIFDAADLQLSKVVAVTAVPAPLRGTPIASLAKGASYGPKAVKFSAGPAKVSQLQGKYLIIVSDFTGAINELNETNNIVVVGPLTP